MANYYWTGAVGSDVNNKLNWTYWNPSQVAGSSVSPPPSPPTSPTNGDYVIFTQLRVTGGVNYPINTPSGTFMNGLSGASSAPASLSGFEVTTSYPLGIGTNSANPINVYANYLTVLKGPTANNSYTRYLKLLAHPGGCAAIPFLNYAGFNTSYPMKMFVSGVGNVKSVPFVGNVTSSSVTFYDYNGSLGPFGNVEGTDNVYLASTVSLDPDSNSFQIQGKYSTLTIEKGFQGGSNSPIKLRSVWSGPNKPTQRVIFDYDIYQGGSGPNETPRTAVQLQTEYTGTPFGTNGSTANFAGATTSPIIDVYQGVDFTNLDMLAGSINFYNEVNQTCRVFEGYLTAQSTLMNVPNPETMVIMPAGVGGSTGFFVQSYPTGSGAGPNTMIPISLGSQQAPSYVRIQMTPDANWRDVIPN